MTIGANFGVGKSTVIEAVQDVTGALFELRNEYIKFPVSEAETRTCIERFSELSNLPNVAGAIDGTHIRIKAPDESAVDYFSRSETVSQFCRRISWKSSQCPSSKKQHTVQTCRR